MLQTKQCLEKLGVSVDVSLDAEPVLDGYDVVHLFNIQTSHYGLRQMENARRSGVPVVLSTIYWGTRHLYRSEDFVRYHCSGVVRALARLDWRLPALLLRLNRQYGTKAERKHLDMLKAADFLLPNSYAEAEVLALEFDAPWIRGKSHFVPNGISAAGSDGEKNQVAAPAALAESGEYVLEVGRIEPIKGQLKLIEALLESPEIPLVFVGRPGNQAYYQRCRELGERRGNTRFIDAVPHEEIAGYYRAAKVHALPSLRESPGLVTLEAAMQGANCVVSVHGPILEYFANLAWCCDPDDVGSLRQAVLQAWRAPRSEKLKERILTSFTWEEAARATLDAYRVVLARHAAAC
jgi:glycosyltransferase involved in cell wall biosynthesis